MGFKLTPYVARHANWADHADRLTNAQAINGISFDGTQPVFNFTQCDSDTGEIYKTASIPNYVLQTGSLITVYFPHGNTADGPHLNVSDTGAMEIRYAGNPLLIDAIKTGHTYQMVYDGSYYEIVSDYSDTPEVRELILQAKREAEKIEYDDNKDTNKRIDDLDLKMLNAVNAAKAQEAKDSAAANKRIDDLDTKSTNDVKAANKRIDDLNTKSTNDVKAANKRIDNLTTTVNNNNTSITNALNTAKTQMSNNITTALNVVAVSKNTSFTVDSTMMNKIMVVTGAATVTVPKIATNGFHVYIKNRYSKDITIKPSGCSIDGSAAAFTLAPTMAILLLSDGANYNGFDTSAKFQ